MKIFLFVGTLRGTGESEDISGLIDLMMRQKSNSTKLFERKPPKGFLNAKVELIFKIKKYLKGLQGMEERNLLPDIGNGGPINEKPEPVKIFDTVPGPVWHYYIRSKSGGVETSRTSGEKEQRIEGQNGDPDTIRQRIYSAPPIPKKDIPRKH